jgi:hypothetical protein
MPGRTRNNQLFALAESPPATVAVGRCAYRLVRVFKHDFFAATCLYQGVEAAGEAGAADIPLVVVKFGRRQAFCGLPLDWYGRWLCRHERGIYQALAGLEGVPRWAGCVDTSTFAIEYVDALPLDHLPAPPPGFFDRLLDLMGHIHARGVAYCDANKRSNILVRPDGRCVLVDYQIAFRRRDDWPWPLRTILAAAVRYVQRGDIYHLYKHKRRLAPGEMTDLETAASLRRGWLHEVHRKLTKPYRSLRRRFLREQYTTGRLESPSASLEDHDQPEKDTWRRR